MPSSPGQRSAAPSRALLTIAIVLNLALVASAQAAPPTIALNPSEGRPGDQLTLSGLFPGYVGEVTALLGGQGGEMLGTGEIKDRNGTIEFPISVPTRDPGTYRVVACIYSPPTGECLSSQANAPLTILGPAPSTTSTTSTTSSTTTTPTTLPLILETTSTTVAPTFRLGVTTTTQVDPPAPFLPPSVAFTTTSVSIPLPSGLAGGEKTHFPDLEITAVEVTQGIQDLQNRMPLIANRRTLVRVYVAADRIDETAGLGNLSQEEPAEVIGPEGWEPVDGALLLQRGGSWKILYADNAPIVAYREGSNRSDPNGTLNFLLPDEWTTEEVTITAFVWSHLPSTVVTSEPDAGNNYATGQVFFQKTDNPLVVVLRLAASPTTVLGPAAFESAVATATMSYQLRHPVGWPNFAPIQQPLGPGPLIDPNAEPSETWDFVDKPSEPNDRMRWLYKFWGLGGSDRILGLIPSGLSTGKWAGLTAGTMKVAWSKPSTNTPGHEGAHMYAIRHVECKDADNNKVGDEVEGGGWRWIDQTHPNGLPNCSLAPIDPEGYYGVDLYESYLAIYSNDPSHPNAAFPFMSYQGPKFVDPYHYCRLMPTYGVGCNPESIGLKPKTPRPGPVNCGPSFGNNGISLDLCLWTGLDDSWAPSGAEGSVALAIPMELPDRWVLVEADLNTGTLGQAMIVPHHPSLADDWNDLVGLVKEGLLSNQAVMRVVDAGGQVLAQVPFSGHLGGHFEEGPTLVPTGLEQVPWPEGAATVELLIDGVVVDSLTESQPPVVTIHPLADGQPRQLEITWTGEDPDGDSLRYSVLWSNDGGATWRPTEFDIDGNSLVVTDLMGLPGGEVMIQVIATDGLATGSAVEGPFTVETGVPVVLIAGPNSMIQYEVVDLLLHATDPEDGMLTEAVWESSIDGSLGTGRNVSARLLSVGLHSITAAVTDSDGNTTIGETTLEVLAGDLAAPRAEGSVPGADELLLLGPGQLDQFQLETNSQSEEGENPGAFPIGWVAIGGVVAVTGAFLFNRRRQA